MLSLDTYLDKRLGIVDHRTPDYLAQHLYHEALYHRCIWSTALVIWGNRKTTCWSSHHNQLLQASQQCWAVHPNVIATVWSVPLISWPQTLKVATSLPAVSKLNGITSVLCSGASKQRHGGSSFRMVTLISESFGLVRCVIMFPCSFNRI